jgi:truncated hemoglobin YjbI
MAAKTSKPAPAAAVGSPLYEALGGRDVCHRLSTAFYAHVARDPVLRPLFPGRSFTCAIEAFAAYLAQFFGGPAEHMQRRFHLSLHESHVRFKIGQREREAWLANMVSALEDVPIEEPMRGQLLRFFEMSSAKIVNHGGAVVTKETGLSEEFAQRWDAQTTLDAAVAAIRAGDAPRAIMLAEAPVLKTHSPAVIAGLLVMMIRSGQSALLDHARAKLTADPALAHARFAGSTLLHQAAAAGNVAMVELLLSLGADPNALDGGSHTPLYSVGNECTVHGAEVVGVLVKAGADIKANGGVKRCTALHMAARRGNVEVAQALFDCGADLEARDTLGDTPLRRALNCKKPDVAALLRDLRLQNRSH